MEAAIRRLEQIGAAVSGCCVVTIMLVVSADALMRYLLHAPLPWAFDLVGSYLMVAAAYLAISETFRTGDHISITLIHSLLPRRVRAIVDAIISLLALAVYAVIAIGSWNNVVEALHNHEYLPGYIAWPVWISHAPIAVGSAILVLRLLHHVFVLIYQGADPLVHSEAAHVE